MRWERVYVALDGVWEGVGVGMEDWMIGLYPVYENDWSGLRVGIPLKNERRHLAEMKTNSC